MTPTDLVSDVFTPVEQPAPAAAVPMSAPDITAAEVRAVNEVLASPNLSMGEKLAAFERAFAAYIGTRHAVGVNSGTSGLHLAVLAAGVAAGDYVITTPFSFIASANCILYAGAVPVFVDVDPATGNLDPEQAAGAVDELTRARPASRRWLPPTLRARARQVNPARLKAVLPVHAFGQPADLDRLQALAISYGLGLVEDACEAVGAEYRGRRAGTFGNAAVFAFYPNKQMTTGEGGMLVTDDDGWAALFRSLRNQGRDEFNAWLNHARLGYNYRLDELSAAMGLAQLGRIDELIARRAQVAGWYNQRLAGSEQVQIPFVAASTTRMSWFVYVVRLDPAIDRDGLIDRLQAEGIPSRPYFTPIHLQPFYRQKFGYRRGDFPTAEALGDHSLALPFSSVMSEAQVETVCRHLLRLTAEMSR
ncbi:MAG TPA: DegT/DnrJ/EryC1/StrS family aminotransferase [Anaerolineaceae bacterium]|nr:DegT/DnrJ/EryC1/StrS family aminotransferase [Anaerolineaceae bacterium]